MGSVPDLGHPRRAGEREQNKHEQQVRGDTTKNSQGCDESFLKKARYQNLFESNGRPNTEDRTPPTPIDSSMFCGVAGVAGVASILIPKNIILKRDQFYSAGFASTSWLQIDW